MGACTGRPSVTASAITFSKASNNIYIYGPNLYPADLSFKDVMTSYQEYEKGFTLSQIPSLMTEERLKAEYDALNKITLDDAHKVKLDKRFP